MFYFSSGALSFVEYDTSVDKISTILKFILKYLKIKNELSLSDWKFSIIRIKTQ